MRSINWSPDSKWIAFTEEMDNAHDAIFLYNVETSEKFQVTSSFYDDTYPVFSTDGKYLYFLTDRNMQPVYSDMGDATWVYPNATQIAAMALSAETASLLEARNDSLKEEKDGTGEENAGKAGQKKKGKDKEAEDGEGSGDKEEVSVMILSTK